MDASDFRGRPRRLAGDAWSSSFNGTVVVTLGIAVSDLRGRPRRFAGDPPSPSFTGIVVVVPTNPGSDFRGRPRRFAGSMFSKSFMGIEKADACPVLLAKGVSFSMPSECPSCCASTVTFNFQGLAPVSRTNDLLGETKVLLGDCEFVDTSARGVLRAIFSGRGDSASSSLLLSMLPVPMVEMLISSGRERVLKPRDVYSLARWHGSGLAAVI